VGDIYIYIYTVIYMGESDYVMPYEYDTDAGVCIVAHDSDSDGQAVMRSDTNRVHHHETNWTSYNHIYFHIFTQMTAVTMNLHWSLWDQSIHVILLISFCYVEFTHIDVHIFDILSELNAT